MSRSTLSSACLTLALLAPLTLPEAHAAGTATLLTVNDVYRISGIEDGRRGGIARLRTLRANLEAQGTDPVLLHAGDFLFPSLLSRRYRGEQMIDLLNRLDGDASAFDERLFITFGNHEFDKSRRRDASMLRQRIRESDFRWLNANVLFARDESNRPMISASNLMAHTLIESGGVRVGLFALTTDVKAAEYIERFAEPEPTAALMTALLRQQGADVVVALTHLRAERDEALLRALGDAGPDLIVGGHEHERQVHLAGGHRRVIKADADAVTAAVIRVHVDDSGGVRISHEFIALDESVSPAPDVAARAHHWQERYERETCAEQGERADCLSEPLGHTRVKLIAEELEIRRYETNLGNFVIDQGLAAFADQGAQAAIINSGSLRLNQNIPAGAALTQRTLGELFAYPSPMSLIRIDGRTLRAVLAHAITDWTGNGRWLQIAGFAWRHDPTTATATDITLLSDDGPRPIKDEESILMVVNDYLLDPSGDQDGYTMLGPQLRVPSGRAAPDLRDLVAAALRASGERGIAPRIEGRICTVSREGPCLAVSAAD
ncbi:MAG: bifunctional metallophosphatase/5'-nucleotidase [Gammaproteobacteria bacterium]